MAFRSTNGYLGAVLRRLSLAFGAAGALLLGGCVEVDESWTFATDASGTYELTLRWNADVLQRVRDAVGRPVVDAFAGRAFPLRLEEWRDGVATLSGVEVRTLEESDAPGGWHRLHVVLGFAKVEDLLGWEVLARRSVRIGPADKDQAGKDSAARDKQVRLVMEPLTRLPVLDPLLAAEEARRQPPPAAEGASDPAAPPRDPPPLERLGLSDATVTLVERMLAPRLAEVRLSFRIEVAGRVRSASAPATKASGPLAEYTWRWADLAPGQSRRIEVVYVPGEFDSVPLTDHQGDDPKAEGPAVPRKQ